MQELYHKLLRDIKSIGLPTNFTLELREYSKTYFGRYDPNSNTVTLYVFQDSSCTTLFDYEDLLLTFVHEIVHCIQWHDSSFVRRKGVMHDVDFYRLLNIYSDRVKAQSLLKEIRYDSIFSTFGRATSKVCCQYG